MKKTFKRILKANNDKGFTLVELIIVIAIIALLIAMIVPNFLQYHDKARKVRDLEMARVLGTALERVLIMNPDASKQWDDVGASNYGIKFDVRDPYTGQDYTLYNMFEWTLLDEGDITGTYANNYRNGILRDAHRGSGGNGGGAGKYKTLYDAYVDELAQYDINIFYRKYGIHQYRIVKRADNGLPEVWVCAILDSGSDGEGRSGRLYYRLWPDYDQKYLKNIKPQIAAGGSW